MANTSLQTTAEIRIPRRDDPLSPEEASAVITEALQLVHALVGSYCKDLPTELVARSHKFFSVQGLPGYRGQGCGCDDCYCDRLDHFLELS